MTAATERATRLHDAMRMHHLAIQFPCLPDPSVNGYLASYRYTHIADAEQAAESVITAEGILSRQLGVTFDGDYTEPVGSAAHYQRTARLASGLYVYITARAEVGPLVDGRQDAGRELEPVAA